MQTHTRERTSIRARVYNEQKTTSNSCFNVQSQLKKKRNYENKKEIVEKKKHGVLVTKNVNKKNRQQHLHNQMFKEKIKAYELPAKQKLNNKIKFH